MKKQRQAIGATRCLAALLVAGAISSCGHSSPRVESETAPPPAFTPVTPLPPARSGAAWSVRAPPDAVPEIQGTPVTMRAGERCRTFRRLPAKRFTVSTLVQDACLRIPNETTIEVQEGATLAIIATNGLSLGTQVVFNARGARGLRGNRAQFASIYLDASTDQEIRALCVDEGNRCACPTGNPALSSIRGRAGGPGAPGGTLHLISPELVSAPRVTGLGMDVSGGTGGPAGESGTRECTRGAVQCASPACSAGVGSGPDGADGSVFLSLGGEGSAGAVQRMMLTTTPPRAVVIVPLEVDAALREQFKKLEDQAIKEGWQRRSGEDI